MQWIRSQRPGESGINIITADFVELGEFISAVITLNYHLDDDEDDATWDPAQRGGKGRRPWRGAQSPFFFFVIFSFFLLSLRRSFQEGSLALAASFTLFTAIAIQETRWRRGLTRGEVEAALLFDQRFQAKESFFALILEGHCWFSFNFPHAVRNDNLFPQLAEGRPSRTTTSTFVLNVGTLFFGIYSDSDFFFSNLI